MLGLNGDRQLGIDDTSYDVPRPSPVTAVPTTSRVAQIACGGNFTCARLEATGDVLCWGDDSEGQLGRRGGGAVVTGATQVAVGVAHACAATESTVQCWGRNNYGQLGTGDTIDRRVPAEVIGLALPACVTIRQLAIGDETSCVRLSDGTARCWGRNGNGQVGDGAPWFSPYPASVIWR